MEEIAKTILFVYGTLKRDGTAHRRLAGQRYVGEAVTEPTYRLYDLGPYPGLVRDEANGLAVKGELWEVSAACLAELDDYEEVPELYTRERVAVQGTTDPVETYVYSMAIPPTARSGSSWPLPSAGD